MKRNYQLPSTIDFLRPPRNEVTNLPSHAGAELKTFSAILALMGNLNYPRVCMYYEQKLAISLIVENMSVNQFSKLTNNMHFTTEDDKNISDRLWKCERYIIV